MSTIWPATPGSHAVQFYESERVQQRAIAAFLAEGARRGGPVAILARPRVFESVLTELTSGVERPAIDLAGQVLFMNAETVFEDVIEAGQLNGDRMAMVFARLLSEADRTRKDGPLWVSGELVDLLCQRGYRQAAIDLETRWNQFAHGRPTVVACTYATASFREASGAADFRAICHQHTHVFPTERIAHFPEEGTDATIYVIDDDASVRRSLGRLLASFNLPWKSFDSAEAFLAEVDQSSSGCLIVDVELLGMSGLELQQRLACTRDRWPVIAMSGAFDPQVEQAALHFGAVTFLRKPFAAHALLVAIATARAGLPPLHSES